jgi:hypothetical protein
VFGAKRSNSGVFGVKPRNSEAFPSRISSIPYCHTPKLSKTRRRICAAGHPGIAPNPSSRPAMPPPRRPEAYRKTPGESTAGQDEGDEQPRHGRKSSRNPLCRPSGQASKNLLIGGPRLEARVAKMEVRWTERTVMSCLKVDCSPLTQDGEFHTKGPIMY